MNLEMTSNKPYLLRAFYEWIVDNDLTPYIVVNAELFGVNVPKQYVEEGRIILNIAPHAVHELEMSNHGLHFQARFGGVATTIAAPMNAIIAIYAKENGCGMVFNEMDFEEGPGDDEPPTSPPIKGKPKLTIVK